MFIQLLNDFNIVKLRFINKNITNKSEYVITLNTNLNKKQNALSRSVGNVSLGNNVKLNSNGLKHVTKYGNVVILQMTLTNLYNLAKGQSLWIGNVPSGYRPYSKYVFEIAVGGSNSFTFTVNSSDGAMNGTCDATLPQNASLNVFGVWLT